jgi:hypothetical protein
MVLTWWFGDWLIGDWLIGIYEYCLLRDLLIGDSEVRLMRIGSFL